MKKISQSLKDDEELYYICCDSGSELLCQITKDVLKKSVTNVRQVHNEKRRKLSKIMKDILQYEESTKKPLFSMSTMGQTWKSQKLFT